ncbi:MAG: hypothetical protein ACRC2S_23310 [Waterburya sp.]
MKLLLFKVLLHRRARDEGFTLPMVIALGLVMLLLGTVNIVKSSEENISAISQNSSSDALAVAEVGISKYRELLNQNRILTVYNQDQWTNNNVPVDFLGNGVIKNVNVVGQTCNNITTTPTGWEDGGGGGASAPNNTGKWWEIKENIDGNAGDETIGEYRLISYEYDIDGNTGDANNNGILDDIDDNGVFSVISDADRDDDPATLASGVAANSITDENDRNDDGESDAKGILTVQGRIPDPANPANSISVAQIEVEIPLRINDLVNFAPILWVGSGAISTPGTLNIPNPDDNIVLSSAGTANDCPPPAAIAGNSNVISDSRNLPAIIPDPIGIATNKKNNIGSIDTTASEQLLPRPVSPQDNKDDQGRFLYEVTTINVVNNNLVTDGTAKVTLYATDDITINNTVGAGHTMTIGNSNAAISNGGNFANFTNSSTSNTNVSSHNLEIYVAGNQTININPGGGTVNIEAFIHAPEATLNITGGGTVNINGAVWVNNFNNTGATVNIRSDKTSTTSGSERAYKFYTTSSTMTPRPLTSTPTNWVREEVQ